MPARTKLAWAYSLPTPTGAAPLLAHWGAYPTTAGHLRLTSVFVADPADNMTVRVPAEHELLTWPGRWSVQDHFLAGELRIAGVQGGQQQPNGGRGKLAFFRYGASLTVVGFGRPSNTLRLTMAKLPSIHTCAEPRELRLHQLCEAWAHTAHGFVTELVSQERPVVRARRREYEAWLAARFAENVSAIRAATLLENLA